MDPHALFEEWLAEAVISEPNDPTAMALATADPEGRPSCRMVLLKGHDERGFVFYTNLDSRKGGELAENPRAALLFHWKACAARSGSRGRSSRSAATRPMPISRRARAIPSSAPGRPTSPGRSTAAPRSKSASGT